ncbi:alpha/beta hydrolase [Lentzea sp. JNUCC 0626]|uniref:alpha/beta hydrolase n=1 Tax=Lentzea sp. JNUCC 0626 TaxID=3367513 RepID=UPI003747FD12
MGSWQLRFSSLVAISVTVVGLTATAAGADEARHLTGELPDGASWVADVPAVWNGTTILFSHGFGAPLAQNAPDGDTSKALLAKGYALVGSSYSGSSWWALKSAVSDQFGSLRAFERQAGTSQRVIGWGMSMGGLVSALEAEDGAGRLDGALSTCGIVAGAINLNNFQLDGLYALTRLLTPGSPVKLVRYANEVEAFAAGSSLAAATTAAQHTAAGRARTALAAAFMNVSTWYDGGAAPEPADYEAQVRQQAESMADVLGFISLGRYHTEQSAGGNSSFTVGVDYQALLAGNSHVEQVRALYGRAGLDLDADLAELTRDANIKADLQAITALAGSSVPTGRLRVPTLNIHTVGDQLVPVEHESWYAAKVAAAGQESLLAQAYVAGTGHCKFQPSETIAGLHALEARIESGRWADLIESERLNAGASTPGAPGRYVRFTPPKLSGVVGEAGRVSSY